MGELLSEIERPWYEQGERGGLYPLSKHSNVYEASIVVKSGPGKLYGFTVYNSKGSDQFVLLFDTSGVPAEGAIPCAIYKAVTLTTREVSFGTWGRAFNAGIVLCNSSTGPTKTIGSADCFFDAQYL
jgi:hypothetical protein